jgi:NifU-like protein involved in Fe-S cluster formation
MEICEDNCCGNAPRRTVSDLFDRGYRRNRKSPLAIEGTELRDLNGLLARFSLEVADGFIKAVNFRATTCITLLAYSELVAELTIGQRVHEAAKLSPAELVDALPDVPLLKRDRALLAVKAFRAALSAAPISQTGEAA